MKLITLKQTPDNSGDSFIELKDLEDMIDISKVDKYTLDAVGNGTNKSLVLKFFDKDGNVISNSPQLMSVQEASVTLSMSEASIKELIVNKKIKSKLVGKDLWCIKTEILRFKDDRDQGKKAISSMDKDGFTQDE